MSKLMKEVCQLLGVHKVNTTAYHPQTDGLVERFNRTLTDMLAKTVDAGGRNWDQKLSSHIEQVCKYARVDEGVTVFPSLWA